MRGTLADRRDGTVTMPKPRWAAMLRALIISECDDQAAQQSTEREAGRQTRRASVCVWRAPRAVGLKPCEVMQNER